MNYYAQGGQAYGLKALAQELPQYGRGGDSIVAHINPEEAMMLKAMGGSGTINPVTGLPEFLPKFVRQAARVFTKPIQQVFKAGTEGVKAIQNIPGIKQISDVATQAVRPIDQALVGLDKFVGKTIPGGYGTLAAIAASMIPGGQFAALGLSKSAALGGLGALTGSGVMRKGGSFNLQGALVGGALAYGSAKLMTGLEGAANTLPSATVDAAGNLTNAGAQSALTGTSAGYTPSNFLSGTSLGAGQGISSLTPTANALAGVGDFVAPAFTGGTSGGISGLSAAAAPASFGLQAAVPAAGTASIGLGNIAVQPTLLQSAGNFLTNLPSNVANKASGAFDALTTPSNYSDFAKDYAGNVAKIGEGAKNLITGAPNAAAGFKAAGATLSNTALPIAFGMQGMTALDEQRNFLNEQKAAGNIAQAEYDAAMAEIDRSVAVARDAVARNPFNSNPDRSATIGDTDYRRADADENLYNRFNQNQTLYAKGGEVEHFFIGGLSEKIAALAANAAPSGAGFQNLKSEGMPSPQSSGGISSGSNLGVGFQNLRSEGMRFPTDSQGRIVSTSTIPKTFTGDVNYFSSPEYQAFQKSGMTEDGSVRMESADLAYTSPYFGMGLSSSFGRRQDQAYEDYLKRIKEVPQRRLDSMTPMPDVFPTGGGARFDQREYNLANPNTRNDIDYVEIGGLGLGGLLDKSGITLYDKLSEKNRIYDDLMNKNYAVGGSIDDESGMDEARGLYQGNLSNGFMNMGSTPAYDKGGKVSTSTRDKERRDYLDMLDAEFMFPPAQYVEGMGFMSPPQSVGGKIGANFDALGGNLRAGVSGTAMRDPEGNIRAMPGMFDVGYKGQVGPGELDVGLQRAIRAMPGRNKDYALNAKYSVKFAEGGQPRFLSGGGDGMSDSIKASINGTQEARLADGEFVIPSDVVSHLGNGSSKAGAKRLYSMMDKVRSARTGTKRQGKQINPKQFMPV